MNPGACPVANPGAESGAAATWRRGERDGGGEPVGIGLTLKKRDGEAFELPLPFLGIGLFLLWGFSVDLGGPSSAGAEGVPLKVGRVAMLVTCGLTLLVCAVASRRVPSLLRGGRPMLLAAVSATIGSAATAVVCTFYLSAEVSAVAPAVPVAVLVAISVAAGLLMGVGMALMALVWMDLYARLEPARLLPTYAMGLFAFAVCGELCAVSALPGLDVLLAVALPGVSMAMARACRGHLEPAVPAEDAETLSDWTFPFKPVVLIAVGCFATRLGRAFAPGAPELFTNLGDLAVSGLLLAAVLWRGKPLDLRVLYRCALPLSLAALLMPLLSGGAVSSLVALASGAGTSCLATFCMVFFCSISYRYGVNALWLFGFSRAARIFAGLAATTCADLLVGAGGQAQEVATVVTAIALVACFMWALNERDYETTWGMEPAPEARRPKSVEDVIAEATNAADAACMLVSRRYGLTRREEEVLAVLYGGGGVARLEEALSISKGTARVHVRHIYAKLGIHSREELVELVGKESG